MCEFVEFLTYKYSSNARFIVFGVFDGVVWNELDGLKRTDWFLLLAIRVVKSVSANSSSGLEDSSRVSCVG
jgi:hypothetical protein